MNEDNSPKVLAVRTHQINGRLIDDISVSENRTECVRGKVGVGEPKTISSAEIGRQRNDGFTDFDALNKRRVIR